MMPSIAASKIISEINNSRDMARSKTGSFWLTETLEIPVAQASGAAVVTTLDLGAYVDVGDQQAIAIESVDFVLQVGTDFSGPISQVAVGDSALNIQVVDLNPGTDFVRADDNSLIASAHLDIDDSNNSSTSGQDFYPDNFGKLDESRMVVNDSLFVIGAIDGQAAADNLFWTARIKCRIVKLGTKDWMAIAIQSTASDN